MFQVGIRWHENAGEDLFTAPLYILSDSAQCCLNLNAHVWEETQSSKVKKNRWMHWNLPLNLVNVFICWFQTFFSLRIHLSFNSQSECLTTFCCAQGTNGSQLWDTCFAVQAFLEVMQKLALMFSVLMIQNGNNHILWRCSTQTAAFFYHL